MISQDTLFILGAGASKPYGYPTGAELRKYICDKFVDILPSYTIDKVNRPEREYMNLVSRQQEEATKFVKAFKNSTTKSIDQFLAISPSFSEIGKLAISTSILQHESIHKFREGCPSGQDWYSFLFQKIIDSFKSPDDYKQFKNSKINFITFNYDRSLEHFLYDSIVNLFHDVELEKKIQNNELSFDDIFPFEIYHVYGIVAPLPWQNKVSLEYGAKVAGKIKPDKYLQFKNNISTIHEIESTKNEKIKEAISHATKIFFLGFGYADENLKAIGLPALLEEKHIIFGTAYEYTKKEIRDIVSKLRGSPFGKKIVKEFSADDLIFDSLKIEDRDCCSLMREYL